MQLPHNQPTVPNPALQADKQAKIPPAPPQSAQPTSLPKRQQPAKKRGVSKWLLLLPFGLLLMGMLVCGGIIAVVGLSYGDKVLPAVYVVGINIGGLTQAEAQIHLENNWQTITLLDQRHEWDVNLDTFGISLNSAQTIENAFAEGRNTGNFIQSVIGQVDVAPVLNIDVNTARIELERIAEQVNITSTNAGVEFVDGQVRTTDPINGRQLDVQKTITQLQDNAALLTDGQLDLVMNEVPPAITDSSSILLEAERLLSSSLDIRVFDPVTGDSIYWSLPPDAWSRWLTAQSDSNSPIGLSLVADENRVRDYLNQQSDSVFDESRFIDVEQGIASIQNALANGDPTQGYMQVQHRDRQHIVQAGESITSIAWDYGIPYLYIQQMNNGIEGVSPGQSIIIPRADYFLEEPVVTNKRIVVSISQQKTWVYENGQLIWVWVSSTGIPDSPTWPGTYQILSHEPNAYAGNWDLWMPNFMGVYRPVPGSEFTNGFHGFPTRGGGQLLWENSLGRRVTYGCVLLHDDHVKQLYDWAETGVIVEIQA